ncbi:MAG: CPBP family intramembrane metalloprotease [Chloroflexi bacterium]|nr:CPBP family intramembrane metalloprotease [Chloroflexota bacterium]
MKSTDRQRLFFLACLFEALLVLVAAGIGWPLQQPLPANLHWSLNDAALGIAAAIPMFLLLRGLLRSSHRSLVPTRVFLETVVRPVFGQWSLAQLILISILAGVCEEILFRGVLQAGLTGPIGPAWALAVTSGLFGLCHLITWMYAVIAGLMGAYLGFLFLGSGNVLAPMVAHALYDFVALVYFLRVHRSEQSC